MQRRQNRSAPDPSALVGAFQAAAAAQDWPAAVTALDALVGLAPDNAALHYNRALALRQAGRPADAVAAAERALALEPTHPKAPFERAAALMDSARYGEAAAGFDVFLAAAPGDGEALRNLARCRLALGHPQAALDAIGPVSAALSLEEVAIAAEALRDLGRLDDAHTLMARLPPARALKLRTHGAIGRLPVRPSALAPRRR